MKRMKPIKNYEKIIIVVIFSLMPVLACLLMCLKDGIRLSDVYLANSRWNDELFYYKTIEGVARYNSPLGYFGYNGSSAKIGHFGPWSPVLYVFYIIYAKICGWSISSPIHCNILLMTIALAVFALLVRPTKQQTLYIFLLYSSCTIVTRYIFSNLPEVTIYALLIVFLGVAVKIYRQLETKFRISYIIALNIIAFLLVLMRPYWILLFMVPGYFCWEHFRKKPVILIEIALACISAAIYFLITSNCCASYFSNIINTAWLELLFSSPADGIYNILYIMVSSMYKVLLSVGDGIIYGYYPGAIYMPYLAIIGYAACKTCTMKKGRAVLGILVFSLIAMLMAVFYLYDINVGSRHIIGFIFSFVFLIPIIENSAKNVYLFWVGFIWIFCIRATDIYTYQLPVHSEEMENVLLNGYEKMTNANMVDESTDNPWDNTIIWLYSDVTPTDHTYFYALPEGMGINLCTKNYVLANFTELEPKYILANIGEEVDLLCQQEQKELIAEYGNVHVWKLRQ